MIQFKDSTNMSNSEIMEYRISLEEEFNKIKEQITILCEQLETLDIEYNKVEEELKTRQNIKQND